MKLKWVLLAAVLTAAATAVQAADAKTNWDEHCAKCHGMTGKGDTKIGLRLKVKDYTDPKVQADLKDDAMVEATLKGVTVNGKERMKGYSDKLSSDEAKALVALIRGFKS